MNFLKKPKVLPQEMVKIMFACYSWGFEDRGKGLEKVSFEDFSKYLNTGYKRGVKRG